MSIVLEIIKKNVLSLICLLVAVVAVGSLFYPVNSWFDKSQKSLEERKALYARLEGLRTKPRSIPALDPENPVQQKLGAFPSEAILKRGQEVTEQMRQESIAMVDAAVKLNKHDLLVKDCLPDPHGKAVFGFRDQYRLVMGQGQKGAAESPWFAQMQAGALPSEGEIKAAQESLWDKSYQRRRIAIGNGQYEPATEQILKAEYERERAQLPARIREERATTCKVYASPDSLSTEANCVRADGSPTPDQIWRAQVGLWIQQDMVKAIRDLNAASTSVLNAPVKRLIKIDVPDAAADRAGETPRPAAGGADAPLPRVFTASPTGRVSNSLYDVYQFKLSLVVDASRVPAVLQGIQQSRLVTVHEVDMVRVDSGLEAIKGFLYGPQQVVQLDIKCEALFMRQWTEPLMPAAIRKALGIAQK